MSSIPRRSWVFAAIAVAFAALFSGLGAWQVSRMGERRALNAARQARLDEPRVVIERAGDLGDPAWRRVSLVGLFDYENEIVVRGRADHGTPGVHLVTPLVLPDGPPVLVLRGWLPAPDGVTAPLADARPSDPDSPVSVAGIAQLGVQRRSMPPRTTEMDGEQHLVLGALDLADAAAGLPYEIARYYVHATELPVTADGIPRTVPPPALDGGPHLMYAIQWFSFAAISLVGALLYLRSRRRAVWHIDDS